MRNLSVTDHLIIASGDHSSALYKQVKAFLVSSATQGNASSRKPHFAQAGMVNAVQHFHQLITVALGCTSSNRFSCETPVGVKSLSMQPAFA
jgi:hypothetical protein